MVKNTTGGKYAKGAARKNQQPQNYYSHIRYCSGSYEKYAIVLQAFGGGHFKVKTIEGQELMLSLGGKFKGKNKKNNFVEIGKFVLVGLRDYENPAKHCELLELYSSDQVEQLSTLPTIGGFFHATLNSNVSAEEELGVVFTNKEDIDVVTKQTTLTVVSGSEQKREVVNKGEKLKETLSTWHSEEIDFDSI